MWPLLASSSEHLGFGVADTISCPHVVVWCHIGLLLFCMNYLLRQTQKLQTTHDNLELTI